jgi:flagellar biosynthesis anti-sigma factor FlgM
VRVDLYSAAATTDSVGQTGKSSNGNVTEFTAARNTTEDRTSLSSNSASVIALTQAAQQTFSARAEKVQSLQNAVSTGQYQVDPGKIADALTKADV